MVAIPVYVFDSSVLLRYIDNEPGADRVNSLLKQCVAGSISVHVSALQWGETAGNLRKRFGAKDQSRIMGGIVPSEVEIVSVDGESAVRAAGLRVDRKIAYADAIALDLAMQSVDRVLLTADYGFKAVEDLARVEFLPAK